MSKNNNIITTATTKLKLCDDININGRVYFLPDKYIENKFLAYEHKQLYKFLLALYLDLQITTYKIESIKSITKTHINNGIIIINKLMSYITTGQVSYIHLTSLEKTILNTIPEELINTINPNSVEKYI
jgi:hypothetical protein